MHSFLQKKINKDISLVRQTRVIKNFAMSCVMVKNLSNKNKFVVKTNLPGENRTQSILSFVILLLNTSELDSPSIFSITKLEKMHLNN